jgi:hypothetical protein
MNTLITELELYFGKKAPQLPAGIKEGIVKFGPYVLVVGIVISIFGILALLPLVLGVSALYGSGYPGYYGGYGMHGSMFGIMSSLIVSIAVVVLELMAVRGLFKRTASSWKLLFYATLVSLVGTIIHMNIIGFVVTAIIGFYILFQIRSYYNGIVPATESITPPPTPPQTPVV